MPPSAGKSVGGDAPASICGCPDRCRAFELLPIERGIMIALDLPRGRSDDDSGGSSAGASSAASAEAEDSSMSGGRGGGGACSLKLCPQEDANLPEFHPNIYVPASLLDYPDRLVKYGGGGSGVTVFGGYHPLLGDLVMKHGGHKDLIELVSLAKIDREMSVRGKWKIDELAKGGKSTSGNADISQADHPSASSNPDISHTDHPPNGADDGRRETRKHSFTENLLGALPSVDPNGMMKKLQSQPILASMMNTVGTVFSSGDRLSSNFGRHQSEGGEMTIDNSVRSDEIDQLEKGFQIQAIQSAMEDMRRRIPSFRMIYISPMHVRERKEELRNSTFHRARGVSLCCVAEALGSEKSDEKIIVARSLPGDQTSLSSEESYISVVTGNKSTRRLVRRKSSVLRKGRTIHLFGASSTKASSITVEDDHVDMCFGGSYQRWNDPDEEEGGDMTKAPNRRSSADGSDGYASLMAIVDKLRRSQEKNDWKITLAQQTIGDDSADTASSLLAQGKLRGALLHHLIDSEIQVIRDLQLLTMPEELDMKGRVQAEYNNLMARRRDGEVSATEVSSAANNFVGRAIHKNFHPLKGRFVLLRRFGMDLRKGNIHLKPKEVIPAKHLENLFCGSGLNDEGPDGGGRGAFDASFDMYFRDQGKADDDDVHGRHPIFDLGLDQWQFLLELSLSMKHPNATNPIWTCGLTDGGLHNMFLSEGRMWLFDLGEPSLEPIPAFLTKFLMSFFHTLGMEEDEHGDWIVRFEQDDAGRLRLTERTRDLLPAVMDAFNVTVDRLVAELFGGEEELRVLLLRYVVTQLLSDAAFCIEKWRTKGGGDEHRSEHQYFLEKWLWRAIWDVYASEEIRRRYLTSRLLLRRQMEHRDLSSNDLGSIVE